MYREIAQTIVSRNFELFDEIEKTWVPEELYWNLNESSDSKFTSNIEGTEDKWISFTAKLPSDDMKIVPMEQEDHLYSNMLVLRSNKIKFPNQSRTKKAKAFIAEEMETIEATTFYRPRNGNVQEELSSEWRLQNHINDKNRSVIS